VILALLLCGLIHGGFLCDSRLIAQPGRGVQEQSDYVKVKDRYSNHDYGYSVRIPKGLTALQSRPPFPNHGFVIELSEHPKASLSVDASYNAAEWSSFAEAIAGHLEYFKHDVGGEVSVVARTPTLLGGLRAIRFTMKSKTSAASDPKVREVLLAFRKAPGEVGIVYEITLTTLSSRYDKDKHLLVDLQRTWKLRLLPK
jgi:hypothetical protein